MAGRRNNPNQGGAKFLTQLEPPATMTSPVEPEDYETCGEGLTS
ncbi:MAG: hypothetical protein U0R81_03220 [Mycobacterium sp.]